MVTESNEIDEIYHRMAVLRRDPHTNVSESVAGAEAVVDWGRYAWTYPWVALGAAAAVGYLVYTGRHQRVTLDIASLTNGAEPCESDVVDGAKGQQRSRTGPNLLLAAWGILFPVAVRAGQNYMLHWIEQQYATKRVAQTTPSPSAGERGDWMDRLKP